MELRAIFLTLILVIGFSVNDAYGCDGPTADFTVDNATPVVGQPVTFTNASSDESSWSWNFGSGANPATRTTEGPHSVFYTTTGTKTVALTVGNTYGNDTKTKTNFITVQPTPVPTAGNNGPVCAGQQLNLTASTIAGATYSWTGPNGFTSTSQNPVVSTSATTAMAGTYTVRVTLYGYQSSPATTTVVVNSVPAQPGTITGSTAPCFGSSQVYSVTNVAGVTYNWTFPSGWTQTAGGTTNSVTVTVGSGTGNIQVTPSNGCGSGTARTLAVTVSPNTWTGAVSGDWNNTGNWSCGVVPNAGTNVTIASGVTPPTISGTPTAICNNITINAGATLTISSGQALTVNGNLTNNGGLTIESSGISSSGSLIVNGSSTGNVTYNRTIPGDEGTYHYIASPVSPSTIASTKAFYPYNEEAGTWASTITAPYAGVISGTGYAVIGGGTISFNGPLVMTDLVKTVTSPYYTAVGDGSPADYEARWASGRPAYGAGGFNLLGNPYTSAMSATEFITANADKFDPGYQAIYLYNGSSYNYIGVPVEGWEVNDPAQLSQTTIQAGQGFFVLAEINNTTFTFSRSMQEHSTTSTMLKSAGTGSKWPGMSLNVKAGNNSNSTLIVFDTEMKTGLDEGYDVGMISSGAVVEIYTKLPEGSTGVNFARQALPEKLGEENVIPVGLNYRAGGSVTFSAIAEPLRNSKFWLEDRLTGTFTDLETESYTVSLPANTKGTGRFFVHVKSSRPERPVRENPFTLRLKIWTTQDREIHIQGTVSEQAVCEIYSLIGRKVYEEILTDSEYNIITVPSLKSGIYVVVVRDGKKVFTQMVNL